jgi:hypothetical protein
MRFPTAVLLVGVLGNIPVLQGQQASATRFKPLEFLVGSCWTGTFPDGKRTDEHCFEWVFGRAFIRDRHVVHGGDAPYAGESLFRWDGKSDRLAFWYWNSQGGVSEGSAEHTPEGIVFPERYTTDSGVVAMKAVWTRTGPDSYRVLQAEHRAGNWKTLWTMELTRRH